MLSTADAFALYKTNLAGAGPKYVKKIMAVSVHPGVEAAKKEATLKARFNEAVDSGKWGRNVQRMPVEEWKKRAAGKGASNLTASANYSEAKMKAFFDYWLPAMESLKSTVRAMPNATKGDRRARAIAAWDIAERAALARIGGAGY